MSSDKNEDCGEASVFDSAVSEVLKGALKLFKEFGGVGQPGQGNEFFLSLSLELWKEAQKTLRGKEMRMNTAAPLYGFRPPYGASPMAEIGKAMLKAQASARRVPMGEDWLPASEPTMEEPFDEKASGVNLQHVVKCLANMGVESDVVIANVKSVYALHEREQRPAKYTEPL